MSTNFSVRLREAMGPMTPAKLAREAGLRPQMVDSYLKGSMPGADKAVQLARVLDVPVEWLVTGAADPMVGVDRADWMALPFYRSTDLLPGAKPKPLDIIPVHRAWLTPTALAAPNLWLTDMPSTMAEGMPEEGSMLLCTDAALAQGEGTFLFRYLDMPMIRRVFAPGVQAGGVMDVTMVDIQGMETVGRVLGTMGMRKL